MKIWRTVSLLIAILVTSSVPAHANTFDMNGASCVPDSTTAKQGLYEVLIGGAIRFKSTKTGGVQFVCAVPVFTTPPSTLRVRYRDVGSNTSRILVTFWGCSKSRGGGDCPSPRSSQGIKGFSEYFTTDHVNSYAQGGASVDYGTVGYGNSFVYYVKIGMSRASTSEDVILYSVSLQ